MNSNHWQCLITQIEQCNPQLAKLCSHWQSREMNQYSNGIWQSNSTSPSINRDYLAELITQQQKRLGLFNSPAIQRALNNNVVLSAHHTASLCHPIALQTLILACLGDATPKDIVVLCTDWIPMDNLFYPRGFLIKDVHGNTQAVNLFAKSCKKQLVADMPGFAKDNIEKVQQQAEKLRLNHTLTQQQLNQLSSALERYYLTEPVINLPKYKDQCALVNHTICQALFPEHNIIFVNISDIACSLLIEQLRNDNSVISQLLTKPETSELFINALEGEPGCWSRASQQGSILFWCVNNGKMVSFNRYNNGVLANDFTQLPLQADALIRELQAGTIIPGMAITFIVLMFGQGLVCAGGMRQIAYTHAIKQAFINATGAQQFRHHPVDRMVAGLSVGGDGVDPSAPCLFQELANAPIALENLRHIPFRHVIQVSSENLLALS